MNVNRVLFLKSNDSQKFYSSNKPGDFTTKNNSSIGSSGE